MGWEFVEELIELLKPETPSAEEEEFAQQISDTDFTIYSEKLSMLCEEAKEAFVRSGVTTMLLSGDLVVGIYTAVGDLVTALCGTYIHAVSGGPPIKYLIRRWQDVPTVGIHEGDFFFFNDPLFGSLHSPDEGIVQPVFYHGELIAWVGAAVQQTEIGAIEPGMAVSARSRFDEGLKMPPIKIGENYQLREDLVEGLANMTRTVEMHVIDTKARSIACDRVRKRLQELGDKKGVDFLKGLFRKVIFETEQGVKNKISNWNDGTYRHVTFFDSLGYREGLVKVTLALEKKGEMITMDFSKGTSPENDGAWNNFGHMAVAHAIKVLYEGVFSDLPPSAGVFTPFSFKFARGSILHASENASTMLSPPFLCTIFQTVETCFSKMMFANEEDRPLVTAPIIGVGPGYIYGGLNQWGIPIADINTVPLNTGGGGGKCGRDGENSFAFCHCPWGKSADIEDMENEAPWFHLYFTHLVNSGGCGRWRGGAATAAALVLYHTPHIGFSSMAPGTKALLSNGLFGGYAASTLAGIIIKGSDVVVKLQQGTPDLPRDTHELIKTSSIKGELQVTHNTRPMQLFATGDIFVVYSSGAGGYGDVLERTPEAVLADLQQKLISSWVVRNVYRVVYDENTLEIDYEATDQFRQSERQSRLNQGKDLEDFMRGWTELQPNPEALEYFGTWPEGEPNRVIIRL